MSRFFHLNRNQKKSPKKKIKFFKKINIKVLNLSVFSLIIILFFSYLVQINAIATSSYRSRDLNREISALLREKEGLVNKTLELQSMENIQSKLGQLNMINAGKVDYLAKIPPKVALER